MKICVCKFSNFQALVIQTSYSVDLWIYTVFIYDLKSYCCFYWGICIDLILIFCIYLTFIVKLLLSNIIVPHSVVADPNTETDIWNKLFKNGSSKLCRWQPLNNLKGNDLVKQTISIQFFKGCLPQILLGPFFNTLSHLILLDSLMSSFIITVLVTLNQICVLEHH